MDTPSIPRAEADEKLLLLPLLLRARTSCALSRTSYSSSASASAADPRLVVLLAMVLADELGAREPEKDPAMPPKESLDASIGRCDEDVDDEVGLCGHRRGSALPPALLLLLLLLVLGDVEGPRATVCGGWSWFWDVCAANCCVCCCCCCGDCVLCKYWRLSARGWGGGAVSG